MLFRSTAGLDPKQIIETRELIRGLGGSHTIVLSTHILPEVSMTCGRVLIINKGRVVAEDTPDNLMLRLKGAAGLHVDVRGAAGPEAEEALRAVPGVASARAREAGGGLTLDVDVQPDSDVRAEIARCVVQKGWDLLGLTQAGMSLEEIFLHLTTSDEATNAGTAPAAPEEVNA